MRHTPIILSVFATILSFADIGWFVAGKLHYPNTKVVPQDETTMFFVYMLPSLIGFIASLASPWAKQLSGFVMIFCGFIAGFVLVNVAIAIIVACLYISGGMILLFEKAIHEATKNK